ncbi:restriction endonuclease subunit S [Klebsiella pneumoniae]|uniref:restriction endonuclease subunit S n=1 Tax=Klebsiella pneumoniae TaxID=573 RepID=UPI000C7D4000|nr:restriction endonuclease subunit S [Klebsiella pneumoniae]PLM59605.1 restriction endonuclease subunit S [Klebsiella pneumoniae]HBQ3196325.1 restriction endonuclease subunit S [Klebsiella variicola subsp. variicola]HCB1178572.1 restriction endonuclease subunit S [Klebsiella pneumoniae]HDT1187222.1 restriction endonuclease subunit S [Klebsiella pneumoniae]
MEPKEWDFKSLDELALVERGKFSVRPRNDPRYFGGSIPFVQTGDISSAGTYLNQYTQTLNAEGVKVSKVFPKGTILITIAANIGDTAITTFDVACPDSVVAIQPYKERVDVFWLKNVLDTKRDELDSQSTQNAQKNINLQVLKPLLIRTPPLLEQKMIAQILSTWDKAIATTEQLLNNSQKQKKALMQQLLTGKKRFSEFKEDWKHVELGSLLEYKQPTPYLVKSTDYNDDYETPVLTAGKTFVLGYTNESEGIYKDKLPVIIFDDFTTDSKFVDFPFKAKSSAMKILTARDGVSIKYVFEAMQMLDFTIGGHQRHWISIFSNLVISIPEIAEQQKIASVLSTADSEIETLKQQLNRLEQEKKALMQQLLTGKRRVKMEVA